MCRVSLGHATKHDTDYHQKFIHGADFTSGDTILSRDGRLGRRVFFSARIPVPN